MAVSSNSSNEKSPSRLKYEKSMNYGKYALKLFHDSNNNKKKKRDAKSDMSPLTGGQNYASSHANKTPGPSSKSKNTHIAANQLTFDTPKGQEKQQRKLGSIKSEVDFILGNQGGRPSAMTIDLPNTNSRKTSL